MEFLLFFQPIWTVIVMMLFTGVIVWAYNGRRKQEFEDVASLVVADDDSVATTYPEHVEGKEQHHV